MARTHRIGSRHISSRQNFIRQVIILALTIAFGILVSVSVNAQGAAKPPKKKSTKRYARVNDSNACEILHKKRTARGERHKRRTKTTHTVVRKAGTTGSVDFPEGNSIIRAIVAQRLRERSTAEPIELTPLSFIADGGVVRLEDENPYLFAVEFALQGRTIRIENQVVNDPQPKVNLNTGIVAELVRSMKDRGVPAERITVITKAGAPTTGSLQPIVLTIL